MTLSISIDKTGAVGKKAKVCKYEVETLYTDNTHETAYSIDPTNVVAINLYDNTGAEVPDGYHVVETSGNDEYIIYVQSGKISQFMVDNSGSGVQGWCLAMTAQGVTNKNVDYTDIEFGGLDEAGAGETKKDPGDILTVGNVTCSIADIATLVNFFKTEGKANGPWHD
jgi:hypothetical protein